MSNVDMAQYIAPKSDQLNADDLIGGPRTIRITAVKASPSTADQPVSISFEGDDGRPWKPCKTTQRVLVSLWGTRGESYVGRSLTLYRDDSVMWGGIKVGGIRISHAEIDADVTFPVTVSKKVRKMITIKRLVAPARTVSDLVEALKSKGMDADARTAWLASVAPGKKPATLTQADIDDLYNRATADINRNTEEQRICE